MKKILLAFDGTEFSEGAFRFAQWMNETEPVFLTGVFIPQVNYSGLWSYSGAMAGPVYLPMASEPEADRIEENIIRFETLCKENHIDCCVHKNFYDFALPELKKETRLADLMILGSEKFFDQYSSDVQNDYLRDAIHASECPVVVVPEDFAFPERNILAYDGSSSSVFAIKQFCYLFPALTTNETILVYSGSENEPIPSKNYIGELVRHHFSNMEMYKLESEPRKSFSRWLSQNPNAILVSGSFGRSALSEIMRKSFVSNVIRDTRLPVFITHS